MCLSGVRTPSRFLPTLVKLLWDWGLLGSSVWQLLLARAKVADLETLPDTSSVVFTKLAALRSAWALGTQQATGTLSLGTQQPPGTFFVFAFGFALGATSAASPSSSSASSSSSWFSGAAGLSFSAYG